MIVRLARHDEVGEALALRRRVFFVEQGVDPAADQDGRDDEALHLIALDDGALLGTCRVLIVRYVARLGRMAVDRGSRRGGIGRALLDAAERTARSRGATVVELDAQLPVLEFYEESGYRSFGEPFVQEGISHVAMEKRLA